MKKEEQVNTMDEQNRVYDLQVTLSKFELNAHIGPHTPTECPEVMNDQVKPIARTQLNKTMPTLNQYKKTRPSLTISFFLNVMVTQEGQPS